VADSCVSQLGEPAHLPNNFESLRGNRVSSLSPQNQETMHNSRGVGVRKARPLRALFWGDSSGVECRQQKL
jgi:hypothetical protein